MRLRTVAAALLLASALPAAAQSDRWGSFQLQLSGYRPRIDRELPATRPYQAAFGDGRGLMARADVGKSLFTTFGTLELGLGIGYFEKYGKGFVSTTGERSPDSTAFKVIPVRLSATYRFDLLAIRYNIPIAPYGRVSLERYHWWVTNGGGDIASSTLPGGARTRGRGATNGYSFSGGVAFLLNFIDRDLGRDMDRNTGVNETYLYADFTKSFIDDFGSSSSWDLSDERVTISGGILFVF